MHEHNCCLHASEPYVYGVSKCNEMAIASLLNGCKDQFSRHFCTYNEDNSHGGRNKEVHTVHCTLSNFSLPSFSPASDLSVVFLLWCECRYKYYCDLNAVNAHTIKKTLLIQRKFTLQLRHNPRHSFPTLTQ